MKKQKANLTNDNALLDPTQLINDRLEEVSILSKEIKESKDAKKSHTFQKLPKHLKRRQMSTNPARIKKSLRQGLQKVSKIDSNVRKRSYERKPSRFSLYRNRISTKNIYLETHIWQAKRFHMATLNSFKLPVNRIEKTFQFSLNSALKNEKRNDSIVFDTSYFNYFLEKSNNNKNTNILNRHIFEKFIITNSCKLNRINSFYIHNRNRSKGLENQEDLGLLLNTYRILGKGALARLELFFGKRKLAKIVEDYSSTGEKIHFIEINYDNYKNNGEKVFTISEDTKLYNDKIKIERLVQDYECGKDNKRFCLEIIIKIAEIKEYGTWDIEVVIPANYGKFFWMTINKHKNAYGGLHELRYLHAVMNKKFAPFDYIDTNYFESKTKEFIESKNKRLRSRNKMPIEESSYSISVDNSLYSIKIENGCDIKGKPQRGGFLYYKIGEEVDSDVLSKEKGEKLKLKDSITNLKNVFEFVGYIYYDNYDLLRGRNFGLCSVDGNRIDEKIIAKKELYYRNTYDQSLFYKCIYRELK